MSEARWYVLTTEEVRPTELDPSERAAVWQAFGVALQDLAARVGVPNVGTLSPMRSTVGDVGLAVQDALFAPWRPHDWPLNWKRLLASALSRRVGAALSARVQAYVDNWSPDALPGTIWFPEGPTPKITSAGGRASVYAGRKLQDMRARWNGAPGAAVRADRSRLGWLVPAPALLAKTANSVNYRERYCHGFCAIGLYQTPEQTWTRLRGHATVRSLLDGRDAVPVGPANSEGVYPWQKETSIPDQVAIGLVDLRQAYAAIVGALPVELRPLTDAGQWAWMLATMAYTVGAGGAALTVHRYAERIAAARETARYGTLLLAVAQDPNPPREPVGHAVARSFQQLRVGQLLDDASTPAGEARSHWYDLEFDQALPAGATPEDLELAVSGAYYSGPRGPLPGGQSGLVAGPSGEVSAGSWSTAEKVGLGIALVLLVGGVYVLATSGSGNAAAPRTLVLSARETARWRAGDRGTWDEIGKLGAVASERGGGRPVKLVASDGRPLATVRMEGGRGRVYHAPGAESARAIQRAGF